MANGQLPSSDDTKVEEKLRRVARFPMIMVIIVASVVAGTLAIVRLAQFFLYGLESFGLKFW